MRHAPLWGVARVGTRRAGVPPSAVGIQDGHWNGCAFMVEQGETGHEGSQEPVAATESPSDAQLEFGDSEFGRACRDLAGPLGLAEYSDRMTELRDSVDKALDEAQRLLTTTERRSPTTPTGPTPRWSATLLPFLITYLGVVGYVAGFMYLRGLYLVVLPGIPVPRTFLQATSSLFDQPLNLFVVLASLAGIVWNAQARMPQDERVSLSRAVSALERASKCLRDMAHLASRERNHLRSAFTKVEGLCVPETPESHRQLELLRQEVDRASAFYEEMQGRHSSDHRRMAALSRAAARKAPWLWRLPVLLTRRPSARSVVVALFVFMALPACVLLLPLTALLSDAEWFLRALDFAMPWLLGLMLILLAMNWGFSSILAGRAGGDPRSQSIGLVAMVALLMAFGLLEMGLVHGEWWLAAHTNPSVIVETKTGQSITGNVAPAATDTSLYLVLPATNGIRSRYILPMSEVRVVRPLKN